ncbi:wall-associated receptor kinase 1-like [Canna indica]|uniref:Wall-associated receptor kinase 1-like n=1 Tax=Canna indica TaxID=4628 RepID=A0AAQ3L7A4_9LILI|nr:wall-associated receptor kinase 1-like [Canna indica]
MHCPIAPINVATSASPSPSAYIKPGCFRESFDLTCDDTHSPPRLVIDGLDAIQIIFNISLQPAELTIRRNASRVCYNATGYVGGRNTYIAAGPMRPFRFSTRNRFTVIGCATFAYFESGASYYVSGCVSLCRNLSDFVSCTGVGCCQSSISPGMWFYQTGFDDKFNKSTIADSSPCSYAFLVDESKFKFKVSDLKRTDDFMMPVALNWTIRN